MPAGRNKRPTVPLLGDARVIGYDQSNHRLFVSMSDGQNIYSSVHVMFNGPADGQAVNQVEPPRRGTLGLVAFPGGNPDNGVWLGSYYGGYTDAIMAGPNDDQIFVNCFSHWSGAYEYQDQLGNKTVFSPDGTFINISTSLALPTMYRHIYDAATGVRSSKTYPYTGSPGGRVPALLPAKSVLLAHSSGTSALIASSGSTSVTGATSASLTLKYGGTTVAIDGSGNASFSGAASSKISLTFGGTILTIDGTGAVSIALASGKNVNITGSGTPLLELGAGTDALALVSKLVTAFNLHNHGGPPPVTPWVAATINSTKATTDG